MVFISFDSIRGSPSADVQENYYEHQGLQWLQLMDGFAFSLRIFIGHFNFKVETFIYFGLVVSTLQCCLLCILLDKGVSLVNV